MLFLMWTYRKYLFIIFCLLFIFFILFLSILLAPPPPPIIKSSDILVNMTDLLALLDSQKIELAQAKTSGSWYLILSVLKEHQAVLVRELHLLEICLEGLERNVRDPGMHQFYLENLKLIHFYEDRLDILNIVLSYYGNFIFNLLKLWNWRLDLF